MPRGVSAASTRASEIAAPSRAAAAHASAAPNGAAAALAAAGALAAAAEEPPRDGDAAFAAAWGEIAGHAWRFDRGREQAAALRRVRKGDVEALLARALRGARLAVEVVGRTELAAAAAAAAAAGEPLPQGLPLPAGAAESVLVQPRSLDE